MAKKKHRNSPGEDVRALARRTVLGDVSIADDDKLLLAEVCYMRYYLLLDLFADPSPSRAYRRALRSLRTLDAKALALDYQQLRSLLLNERDRWIDHREELVNEALGLVHYKWTVTPLVPLIVHPCPVASFQIALQWASFDSHMNLRSADYSDSQMVEYLDFEYRLHHQDYPEDVLEALSAIMKEWFDDVAPELEPHHFAFTSGATAELTRLKATARTKALTLEVPPQLRWYADARSAQFGEEDGSNVWFLPRYVPRPRPAVVEYVPKSVLKNRLISKEPTAMMFAQSDLAEILVHQIEKKSLHIYLRDQSRSRRLAQIGSIAGVYDTVDLSSASDSVTLTHVTRIFRDTYILPYLLACRTPVALISNRKGDKSYVVELEKFAPMGSKICFPVESLVFAVVCELAVRTCSGHRSRMNDYLVYGDDIVIKSQYTPMLQLLLSWLHFKVNTLKTFSGTSSFEFREACGIEAVLGVDVTPLRVPRRYTGALHLSELSQKRRDHLPPPSEAMGACDFVNRCFVYGFVKLRLYIMQLLGNWLRRVHYCDYDEVLCNVQALTEGRNVIYHHPYPTIITWPGDATNYGTGRRMRLHRGSPTWIYQSNELTAVTVAKQSPHDEVDYFCYWTLDPKLGIRERSVTTISDYVERLTYNGALPMKWQLGWH
jgi:hypothetical protein